MMPSLPEPAQAAVVRGMAAFMVAARKTDLPPELRPLQGKHQRLIMARRSAVMSALDDEGLRALVVEWLEDKPAGISKQDRDVLELVMRQGEGWEKQLEDRFARPVPGREVASRGSDELQREKERSRRAREEAKKARETAKRDLAEQQRRVDELAAQVEDLTGRLGGLQQELDRIRKDAAADAATAERELRKARKRADRAEAALTDAEATIKQLRRELTERRAGAPRTRKEPVRPKKTTPDGHEPARRQVLPVPKGRFADAPETLAEWLATPDVHLLVDGYNVSKAEGGFGDLRLDAQRDLLLQAVGKVVRRHRIKATVVFDGSDIPPGASRRARGPVEVEYSRPGEIADDHLIAKLEFLPKYPVIVATNDKELQRRAARLGGTIATSDQLLALIR